MPYGDCCIDMMCAICPATIHPCQHSAAMLRILDSLSEGGKVPPTVDQYMFIFLKFLQSVIPTIEYDYTMDVKVRST